MTSPPRTDAGALPAPPLLAADAALFLDFDGTLAEIAPTPDAVAVDATLPAVLAALARRQGGALAIVTGRPLAEVDALLAPARLAGAGQHGAELRPHPDDVPHVQAPAGIDAIARVLRAVRGGDPELQVEDKGASVALHYRRAPERAAECLQVMRSLAEPWPMLEVITGKCVVEVRRRGADKGAALRALSRAAPFAGRAPVFVGDDRTDEDGFAAARAAGGYGVQVGAGPTLARYRCAGVAAARDWLRASAQAS